MCIQHCAIPPQSLALKPAVLTTDLTLAPIYELVDDDRKRATLRAALDDLLRGNLRVSSAGEGRFRTVGAAAAAGASRQVRLRGRSSSFGQRPHFLHG